MQPVFCLGCILAAFLIPFLAQAQPGSTESSNGAPLDDIVERKIQEERQPLAYQPLREADLLWEKQVWRVIDTREKLNLTFAYPKEPLFDILIKSIENESLTAYAPGTDDFSEPMTASKVRGIIYQRDTVNVVDLVTGLDSFRVVENTLNSENVKRYRIKESWFFDKNTGTLGVRILGIAPLIEEYDNNGNFRYEKPLFWVYYPEARPVLSQHRVFTPGGNLSANFSWEDLFETRLFSSVIYKDSNIYDRKIADYASGTDALMESQRINSSIFNYEHDLWSY